MRGRLNQGSNPESLLFDSRVAEAKQDIATLIQPLADAPGAGGVYTVALLELALERHLKIVPAAATARALVDGALGRVLKRKAASIGSTQYGPRV